MPDRIQRARNFVQAMFQDLAVEDDHCYETILIRDGQYCGHRFTRNGYCAVWFCEEDQVKLYDQQRQLLRVETLADTPLRRAA